MTRSAAARLFVAAALTSVSTAGATPELSAPFASALTQVSAAAERMAAAPRARTLIDVAQYMSEDSCGKTTEPFIENREVVSDSSAYLDWAPKGYDRRAGRVSVHLARDASLELEFVHAHSRDLRFIFEDPQRPAQMQPHVRQRPLWDVRDANGGASLAQREPGRTAVYWKVRVPAGAYLTHGVQRCDSFDDNPLIRLELIFLKQPENVVYRVLLPAR
ncbi:MAG: hypothetical protein HY059_04995 [Proteobacteria bacterium]|nr:hypothetical protein [Pseudomonadota bacterium]